MNRKEGIKFFQKIELKVYRVCSNLANSRRDRK